MQHEGLQVRGTCEVLGSLGGWHVTIGIELVCLCARVSARISE